jgi:hypothetical protein
MNTLQNILTIHPLLNEISSVLLLTGKDIFGVPFSFVLLFLGKLSLLFIASAIVSKIFHLDRVYDPNHSNNIK